MTPTVSSIVTKWNHLLETEDVEDVLLEAMRSKEASNSRDVAKIRKVARKQGVPVAKLEVMWAGKIKGKSKPRELVRIFKETVSPLNLTKAGLLSAAVLFINTAVFTLTYVIFGSRRFAFAATAVIAAPVTEEYAKKVSIEGGFDKSFALVGIGGEAAHYTVRHTMAKAFGTRIKTAVIMGLGRMIPAAAHLSTMRQMKRTATKKKVDGKVKLKVKKHVLKTQMFKHMLWNALPTILVLSGAAESPI